MDLFNKKKVAELERKIAMLCGPALSAAEIRRRNVEKAALAHVREPTERKEMSDSEFIAAVHEKAKGLIAEKYTGKWRDVSRELTHLLMNARENVLADMLPTHDVCDAGHGYYRLVWAQPEKFNLNSDSVIGAGYRFVFVPTRKLLNQCKLRKTKNIYGNDLEW